ncbi:MAG: 3-hydroxybutyryl-CoA dehydrogenase [Candidatus Marinimicrobia bacterium]|nr:3-hydroxybutyryl-CoA dehydrogenase [Candidatus Neomarinimicrobiota bacterium]
MNENLISVIGSGTMGNGIAHVFATCPNVEKVILVDLSVQILKNAKEIIKKNLDRQVKKEIISQVKSEESLAKIVFTTDVEEVKESGLVIEAVKEDEMIKKNIFKKLDSIVSKDTIMATNTSSISIDKIAINLKKSQNVIGMHFMNPVPVMKLVEIIKGSQTNNLIVEKTLDYVSSLNKIAVECNDSPGFVSNRILMPMINEAAFTLMEGVASAESIDQIMKLGMGHPMGPLKLADLIGIDVCVSIMNVLFDGFKQEKYRVCPLLDKMMKENKLGIKTKKGFYKY